ncbi:hypothetical protein ABPG74_011803 [Tetrahymena malaccensis]
MNSPMTASEKKNTQRIKQRVILLQESLTQTKKEIEQIRQYIYGEKESIEDYFYEQDLLVLCNDLTQGKKTNAYVLYLQQVKTKFEIFSLVFQEILSLENKETLTSKTFRQTSKIHQKLRQYFNYEVLDIPDEFSP